jgi:hypothetical protein
MLSMQIGKPVAKLELVFKSDHLLQAQCGQKLPYMFPDRKIKSCNYLNRLWYSRESDGLNDIEAIQIHHFVPGAYEVFDELRLRVRASIDLRHCP